MRKTRLAAVLTALLCVCLAAALCVSSIAADETWLGAYTSANEELNAREYGESTEMNAESDSLRTFEYGFRSPTFDDDGNITSYMGGGTIGGFTPLPTRGTGITVAENTAKLKLKTIGSGSGGARYRYAYPVELNGMIVENNFSELQTDDHIAITFSKNYETFRHSTATPNGITLIYYTEAGGDYIKVNFGRNNATSLTEDYQGQGFTDIALPTNPDEEESYSVRTVFTEAEDTVTITVSNGGTAGAEYSLTFNKTQIDGLKDDAGRTWINLSSLNDSRGNDSNDYCSIFTMRVTDSLRLAYEAETLNPFKAALGEYTAEKIEAASFADIQDVNEWLAKKDAVYALDISGLRISDRVVLDPETVIAEADAALKEKAGAIVQQYVDGLTAELKETMAIADSDTQFTTIRDLETYNELKEEFDTVYRAATVTYADVNAATPDTAYFGQVQANLARLSAHVRICEVEDLPLGTAAEIAAAKQAYAALNTDAFRAEIQALNTASEIKEAMLARLDAYAETLADAEAGQDPSELADAAITDYENAVLTDLDQVYSALALRKLIPDYSSLPQAAEFAARVEEKDTAVQDAAWSFLEERVARIETLVQAGVNSYSEKATLNKAVAAISSRDLLEGQDVVLSAENTARYEKAVSDADELIQAYEKLLSDNHIKTMDINANVSDDLLGDVAFTDKGLLYTFTGDQQQLIYTQAQDIYAGVKVSFSVKQWAFLTGDGSGYTSNNAWIYFSDTPDGNRSTEGAISLMFWNQVASSYVKTYFNTDLEVVQQTMTTFGEDDGSYVDVVLKANDDRKRFEISVTYNDAKGEAIDSLVFYMEYTDAYSGETYADGVYVGVACFMTNAVGELYNEWYIRSIGDTNYLQSEEPSQPDDGDDDEDKDNTGDNNDGQEEDKGTGCSSSVSLAATAAGAIALLSVGAVLMVCRKKRD